MSRCLWRCCATSSAATGPSPGTRTSSWTPPTRAAAQPVTAASGACLHSRIHQIQSGISGLYSTTSIRPPKRTREARWGRGGAALHMARYGKYGTTRQGPALLNLRHRVAGWNVGRSAAKLATGEEMSAALAAIAKVGARKYHTRALCLQAPCATLLDMLADRRSDEWPPAT